MSDIRSLTVGQAQSLSNIIRSLRDKGFDREGLGLYSGNLFFQSGSARMLDWWLDGQDGVANGTMDAEGHGWWWLRRTSSPTLHHV